MKTCGNCENWYECECGCKDGFCVIDKEFYYKYAEIGDCRCYDGPDDEPERPHYQTDYERDNPRDPVVER